MYICVNFEKMARAGSLPEIWDIPPEQGLEFEVDRINMKVDSLELEMRTLNSKMTSILTLMQRNREGEIAQRLLREISLPNFSGLMIEDAEEFLQDIEQYLTIKQIPVYFQAKTISNALKERAKVWFNAVRNTLTSFDDFRNRFREEFLSEEAQERAKDTWKARRYVDGNLLNYFYARVGDASKFHPPLSEYQVNKTIISQYPREIEYALAGVDPACSKSVVQALSRVEESRVRQFIANQNNARSNQSWGNKNRQEEPQRQRDFQEFNTRQRDNWEHNNQRDFRESSRQRDYREPSRTREYYEPNHQRDFYEPSRPREYSEFNRQREKQEPQRQREFSDVPRQNDSSRSQNRYHENVNKNDNADRRFGESWRNNNDSRNRPMNNNSRSGNRNINNSETGEETIENEASVAVDGADTEPTENEYATRVQEVQS